MDHALVQIISVVTAWWQALEIAVHITTPPKKQREMGADAQLPVSFCMEGCAHIHLGYVSLLQLA